VKEFVYTCMRLTIRTLGTTTIVEVIGGLVGRRAANVLLINLQRTAGRGSDVVVDLARVTAIDIDGLNALSAAAAAFDREEPGRLRLAGVAATLSDLVVVVRLLTAFDAFETVDQALGVSSGRIPPTCRFLSAQPTSTAWPDVASAAGARPH
jgi:anti-anti-sigma regulatory factor